MAIRSADSWQERANINAAMLHTEPAMCSLRKKESWRQGPSPLLGVKMRLDVLRGFLL